MLTRRTVLGAAAALPALGAAARAQTAGTRRLRVGVLNDQSSLYADMGGPGSVVAARLAMADSVLAKDGWATEVLVADHQNKADLAATIARQWFDNDRVDVLADVTNSAVALAVSQIAREKNRVMLVSGAMTSDLTGAACSPNTVHWTADTWAFANAIGKAIVETGGRTWFFITADYAFGHALERDITKVILASGGQVLGHVVAPNDTSDFSAYLLQAQASRAQVIGLANSGGDLVNSVKQAAEFGIVKGGQRLAGLLIYISDVHSIGLQYAQGLRLVTPFYWDRDAGSRAFSARFAQQRGGARPTMVQAGTYAGLLHYARAVAALGSAADGRAVVARMKAIPTQDDLFGAGYVRVDGRAMHPMYLYRVKSPAEQRYPWDYYAYEATIPTDQAFRPLAEDGCPLVRS